ncbi:hypothetical protein SAMN05421796_101413 [Chryseobacterium piscicola]|uniref:Uncharacterized protein n=1 Tax=Chryseobacterium piscicola TaxID=551459 RepID=A0A1N7KA43_9FLAO|nr:hypothetical protein B0A70_04695 [Chryseobacterium piscicola]SIS58478.1 hypothetical protein SAMN05421796_101413 [Chryseobacterium piscicola]
MIRSIIKQWIFINYCGQKIGQFEHTRMKSYMLNIFNAQIGHFLNIIILNFYLFLGFRSIIGFIILLIVDNILIRKIIKKLIMPNVIINQLEQEYNKTHKWKRVLNFTYSIILVIICFLLFVFSFLIQGVF